MRTAQEIVKQYITDIPPARERANKNRAIANMVFKELLPQLVKNTLTFDRAWRKVLKDNPELRGSDYDEEKDGLEEDMMIDLGYNIEKTHI
jgi:hypothetical protein